MFGYLVNLTACCGQVISKTIYVAVGCAELVAHACQQLLCMCRVKVAQQLHVHKQGLADHIFDAQLHQLLMPACAACLEPWDHP